MKQPNNHHQRLRSLCLCLSLQAGLLGSPTAYGQEAPEPPAVEPVNQTVEIDVPTTKEALRTLQGLPSQLIPAKPVGTTETAALAAAVESLQTQVTTDDFQALETFVSIRPDSGWAPSVHLNLGKLYYHSGYFSKSMASFEAAWSLTKNSTTAEGKKLALQSAAELSGIYARVGRMEPLAALLTEMDLLVPTDINKVLLDKSREALWNMEHQPEGSFSCGPYALNKLHELQTGTPSQGFVETLPGTKDGFSLKQLEDASGSHWNMPMQAVRRLPGAELIIPSVAHWKVNHYGAITRKDDNHFQMQDITFENDTWMTQAAVDSESSGLFLIPAGEIPSGYVAATEEEKTTTFGKGMTTGSDTTCTGAGDVKCGGVGSSCAGMAVYSFHSLLASLSISDMPIWQNSPFGPSVQFQVTYNQRENGEAGYSSYTQTSPQWVNNWVSYLVHDPAVAGSNVTLYLAGGGSETHTGYNSTTKLFTRHPKSGVVLAQTFPGIYERRHPDGSKETFGQGIGTTYPRRVFLTAVTDPQNNNATVQYSTTPGLETRISTITDSRGLSMTLRYTEVSNPFLVTEVEDFSGRKANFTYTTTGGALRLTSIKDVINLTSSFAYNSSGEITSMTTPYGTTRFLTGATTVSGTIRKWIEAVDPEGSRERVEYVNTGVSGGPTAAGSAAEVPTSSDSFPATFVEYRNTYFWDKKTMAHHGADYSKAVVTNWNHGAVPQIASGVPNSIKKPLENRVWLRYPGQGTGNGTLYTGTSSKPSAVVRKISGSNNQEIRFEYNSQDNLTKKTDALGRETQLVYASNGIDVTGATQKKTGGYDVTYTASYGATPHMPDSVTDAAGKTTSFTYNSRGQVLTVTNPLAETTTITYENNPLNNGYGDVIKVSGPFTGSDTVFTYDASHRLASVTDPAGLTISYQYDSFDRVTKITHPDSSTEETTYDRLDVRGTKDRQNRWSYVWHNQGRQPVLTADALGQKTQMEWCKCGKLQKLIDAKGNVTKWTYDISGRNTLKTYADGRTEAFGYEASTSRLSTITDAKGQVKTLSYNKDDSLGGIAYSGTPAALATPGVSFTYDTVYNRPLTRTDGLGTTVFDYVPVGTNGAGNLLSEDGPLSGIIDKIVYTYDATSRLKQTQIGSSNVEVSVFDSLGRTLAVQNPLGTFSMNYVGQTSRIQKLTYPNGQRTHYDYFNAAGSHRLQTISNLRDAGAVNYISRQEYTYTPDGNIATWKQGTGAGTSAGITASSTYTFGYDLTDQLTSAVKTNDIGGAVLDKFNYSYDAMGNRTNTQRGATVTGYTSNAANQTTATSGSGKIVVEGTLDEPAKVTVSGIPAGGADSTYRAEVPVVPGANTFSITAEDYSPNANSITRNWAINITGGTASNPTYDANGNTLDDGVRQYEWDAENRLIKITRGANIWEFQYDGVSRRVSEKKNGVMTRRWTWLGTRIAEQLNAAGTATQTQYYGMGEKRLGVIPLGNFFYTRDHLGSIREITTSTAALQARLDYDPYGNVTQTGTFPCQWGFTGHFYDAQIGLHLTLFRAYDQSRGKWLSPDPIKEEGGLNLYSYTKNEPVNRKDALGLDLNYMGRRVGDRNINHANRSFIDFSKFLVIEMHGAPEGYVVDTRVDPEGIEVTLTQLIKDITNDPDYKKGQPILFMVCYANSGEKLKTAQVVARAVKRAGIAANGLVFSRKGVGAGLLQPEVEWSYIHPYIPGDIKLPDEAVSNIFRRWELGNFILERSEK